MSMTKRKASKAREFRGRVMKSLKSFAGSFTGRNRDRKLMGLTFRGWCTVLVAVTLFTSLGSYRLFFSKGAGVYAGAETFSDIAYATKSGKQKLDLYLPERNGKAVPLIINVHGGGFGFFGGSEDDETYNVSELNAAGFAVASVEYRVYQDALFPAGVQDVKAAVRWLRANASTYGIDPNKFGATGRSAGGYMVAALAVTGDQATTFDDPTLGNATVSSAIQAVLDLYGPTNLKTMYSDLSADGCDTDFNDSSSPETSWLGSNIGSSPLAEDANLVKYVQTAKKLPRFLIGHGTSDCNVSPRQSEALADAVRAKGATVNVDIRSGVGHSDQGFDNSMVQPSIDMFTEVFAAVGSGDPTPTPTPTPDPSPINEVSQTNNIIAGKIFTSSVEASTSEPGNPPANLTDANGSTKWVSVPSSPAELTVDLGAVYTLSKVSVKWVANSVRNFSLQVSADGSDWTTVHTDTTNEGLTTDFDYADYTSFSTTPNGKYLRLVLADRWSEEAGNAVFEIGAYGSVVGSGDAGAPTSSVTTPQSGSTVSNTIPVEGVVADDGGVTKVEFLMDGTILATNESSDAKFNWDTTGTSDGSHNVVIKAYDATGKSTSSAAVNVTVQNGGGGAGNNNPSIESFTATPSTINAGGTVTLSWDILNVTTCSLGPDGPQDSSITMWQTPTLNDVGSVTYTLDCQNSVGSHTTKNVSITVENAASVPTKPVLTASAQTVSEGESVGLSWSSDGATTCTLNPGNIISAGTSGVSLTTLTEDTTFELVCQNEVGTTSADPVRVAVTKIPVSVPGPIIVELKADPSTIKSGEMTTIHWASSNVPAGGCRLATSPLDVADPNSSWVTPGLTTSTSYTLTCVNSENVSVSKSVSVTVDKTPVPAAPAAASPALNSSNSTQSTLTASDGQQVSNTSATTEVSGLATVDPTNITDSSREQSISKVEYYNGADLVQTDGEPPFALDTTTLKDGSYTITERTYFTDGSQSEVTRVMQVANGLAASGTTKKSGSLFTSPGFWVSIVLIPLMGVAGILLIRRKLMGSSDAAYGTYDDVFTPTNYSQSPEWQAGLNDRPGQTVDNDPNHPNKPNGTF